MGRGSILVIDNIMLIKKPETAEKKWPSSSYSTEKISTGDETDKVVWDYLNTVKATFTCAHETKKNASPLNK